MIIVIVRPNMIIVYHEMSFFLKNYFPLHVSYYKQQVFGNFYFFHQIHLCVNTSPLTNYEFVIIWNSLNKLISRYSRSNQLDPSARSVSGIACVISSVAHLRIIAASWQILRFSGKLYLPADVHHSLLIYYFERGWSAAQSMRSPSINEEITSSPYC